ncbi:MAG: aldo/keto reductase [Pseudomonadota bacterium]
MPDRKRRLLLRSAPLLTLPATLIPRIVQPSAPDALLEKTIPSTGQPLPVVGMGTWITFNVGNDPQTIAARTEVLRTFLEMGGGMVDSSPMYGSAERVLGQCRARIGETPRLFSATKVWTNGHAAGLAQVRASHRLWKLDRFDLFQVHNLLDWEVHLPALLDMKARDELSYVGITTSHGRRHRDLARVMETQPLDFVQLTYNIVDREVEQRLLPIAAERGIAVICNRPFQRGALIAKLEGKPLPAWASELNCDNWAQFLLKFIVSHPAVTCAIPATSQVAHMRENMGAAQGELPDAATRRRMVSYVGAL